MPLFCPLHYGVESGMDRLSAALGEGDGGFHGFAVAEHGDGDDVADFAAAQGVCEVVEIADGSAAEIGEHVAGLQASLGGRGGGLDIAEAHAIFGLPEIGNGAEPGSIPATATRASDAAMRIFGG